MLGRRAQIAVVTAAGYLASSLIAGCGGSGLQTSDPPKAVSPAGSTVIFNCGGKAQSQPRSLMLACADGGVALSKLRWRNWGDARSTAEGIESVNLCVPDCVAGHLKNEAVTVTVTDLALQGTRTAYRVLTDDTQRGGKTTTYNLTATGPVIDEVAR